MRNIAKLPIAAYSEEILLCSPLNHKRMEGPLYNLTQELGENVHAPVTFRHPQVNPGLVLRAKGVFM